jgi:hypothetical protein
VSPTCLLGAFVGMSRCVVVGGSLQATNNAPEKPTMSFTVPFRSRFILLPPR